MRHGRKIVDERIIERIVAGIARIPEKSVNSTEKTGSGHSRMI
jgi:hypothetical protein